MKIIKSKTDFVKQNHSLYLIALCSLAKQFYIKLSGIYIAVCGTNLSQREFDYFNVQQELDSLMNSKLNIHLYINDKEFKEFYKVEHNEANMIITTYNTAYKCLDDLFEEYYARDKRLDYFLVIDEAYLLLQHISLIEIILNWIRLH